MMRRSSFLVLCFLSLINLSVSGQEVMTLQECIQTTLQNNYGIRIAQQDILVATNNATKEALGYNPTLSANAGGNFDFGGSTQQFGNGNENTTSNAASYGGNASVTANYTIFDQTRAVSLDQLQEVLNLSNLQLRQSIELNMLDVLSLYYEVAKLEANVRVLEETTEVSHTRLERVQYQFDYGQSPGIDVLNAEVDIQRDSINYVTAIQQLANTRRNLNVLMGIPVETDISVDTTVFYTDLTRDELLDSARLNNVSLLMADKNYEITEYDLNMIEAERKPVIGATGSYSFNINKSPPGAFVISSNNRGLALGVNASWLIFDGGLRKIREQNTEIALQTQLIQQEQLQEQLYRDLTNAWDTYQTALFVLQSEAISLETSQKNFDRSNELFKVGQVTSVEFRQAQLNLLTAAVNYNNAKYDAKILELQLLQIAGLLLDHA